MLYTPPASHEAIMAAYYGTDVVSECNSIIEDIKDMILELTDTGLFTTVGYTLNNHVKQLSSLDWWKH